METVTTTLQKSSKRWRKWHSIFFIIIGALMFFGIFISSPPNFSDTWSELQISFHFGRLINALFLQSFVILPDHLTIIALILFLPFKHDRTKLSSAVLITILSLNLIYEILFGAFYFKSLLSYISIPKVFLFSLSPILVILLITVFSFKWRTEPFISGNSVAPKNKFLKIIQSPYWLFNKASNFAFKQKNTVVALIVNVILFIAIGKLIAFCIFGFVWILLPIIAYMLLWALIIAVIYALVYIFFLRGDGSGTSDYVAEDTGCPFAGRILVDKETEVLGFKWTAKETIFTIDNDWNVKSNGKDFGWIDKKGQIRKGIKDDPDATMSFREIIGRVKNNTFYIDNNKVGELVKW